MIHIVVLLPLLVLLVVGCIAAYDAGYDRGWESRAPRYLPPPKPVKKCCTIIGHPFYEHLCDGLGQRLGERQGWR